MEAGQGFTVPRRSLGERSSLRGIGVTSGRDSDVEVLMKDQAPEEMSGDFE